MVRLAAVLILGIAALCQVQAKAPIPPTEVAPLELITADLEAQLESLQKLLAEADKFDEQQEKIVRAGGVIACLSQAAIEHKEREQSKIAFPALRDAGLKVAEASDHAEATEAVESAKQAYIGQSSGEHEEDHAWDELIGMYDLMEEMNDRNGGLSRSLRRSRGKLEEKLNASTNAVLAIAMLADHSYLIEEDQAAEWDQLSKDYQQAMTQLIGAIEKKDQAQIAEFYKAGNRACDKCHESFRD